MGAGITIRKPNVDYIYRSMKVELERKNNAFHFVGKGTTGIEVNIDGAPEIGGEDKGIRPMELLLMSIGGCASIDIGLILKKQRQDVIDYGIEVSGVREENDAKNFKSIKIHVKVTGEIEVSKLEKAIELTVTKYCSVLLSLDPKISIETSYKIEKEK